LIRLPRKIERDDGNDEGGNCDARIDSVMSSGLFGHLRFTFSNWQLEIDQHITLLGLRLSAPLLSALTLLCLLQPFALIFSALSVGFTDESSGHGAAEKLVELAPSARQSSCASGRLDSGGGYQF
jgi:hypothetical protein